MPEEQKETRRFWLKLKRHYFDSENMLYLETVENGEKYTLIWVKLLLMCLKDNEENAGFLRFNDKIPYNDKLLSRVLRMDIDTIRIAMMHFKEVGMIEILDDGTLYIEEVQNMIGSESSSAERVRKHREKKRLLQSNTPGMLQSNKEPLQCNVSTVTLSRNKEIEKDIEKEEEKNSLSDEIKEIMSYFNEICGTAYKDTSQKTKSLIQARMNEGFTIDDFKIVIRKKYEGWNDDPKMREYLRPITLFSNKFESYLNQPNAEKKEKPKYPWEDEDDS